MSVNDETCKAKNSSSRWIGPAHSTSSTIVSADSSLHDETGKAEIEARMAELVDLMAAFPKAEIDTRAWDQLMIYAPKHEQATP